MFPATSDVEHRSRPKSHPGAVARYNMPMHLLLIGPRAAGKTTIGRLLAQRIGRPFIDLDEPVLAWLGESSITAAWQRHGEAAWRAAEARTLAQLLREDGRTPPPWRIIALGGGAPEIADVETLIEREKSAGRAKVVYLRCEVGELQRRLSASPGDRPGLTPAGVVDEVPAVLVRRDPIYRRLADHVLDTTAGRADDHAAGLGRLISGDPSAGG
jgi:shikimate kinase